MLFAIGHLGTDWGCGNIHPGLGNAAAAAAAADAGVDVDDTLVVVEPGAAAVVGVVVAGVVVGVGGYLDNLDLLYSLFLEYRVEDCVVIVLYFLH